MKNKIIYLLIILLLAAISVILYQNFLSGTSSQNSNNIVENDKQLYTCGMHPEIISDEPGNCPICEMKLTPIKKTAKNSSGERKILYWAAPMDPNEIYETPGKSRMGMDLVPVYADEVSGTGIVIIDPSIQQNMNVKTTVVTKRKLSTNIVTNGIVEIDESREYQITSRVGGWIEKMFVNTVGQKVKKGEALLEIYSPELVAGQEEYLSALQYKKTLENSGSDLISTGDDLINSSIKKLKLLELSDKEIEKIKTTGASRKTLPILAPVNGVVLMKNVLEGENVKPGNPLLHIADLSGLWVIADIYENDLNEVAVGNKVQVSINSFPGKLYEGKVDFIYPVINNKTRTAKIRVLVNNNSGLLKPSMLATVQISGKETKEYPVVEEQSIIRSGKKNIVVLALGEGKFKPVEVTLGNFSRGYYQVISGLTEGMKIVTSAQFLIDSESNLKAAIAGFGSDNKSKLGEIPSMDEMDTQNNAQQISEKKQVPSHEQQDNYEEMNSNENGNISELIRTGVIDVESIDRNNDGKLFECPMDWNIISDEAGRCPSCQMKLKEYSIEKVKSNLREFGYKYKETPKHDHGGVE